MVVMYTRGSSKLTSTKRKELILNLCRALSVLKSPKEVADAITDLFTPKEIETVAKRLQIAELLVKGKEYSLIREELKVGFSTISRVNTWLNLSGEGFKIMLTRKKKSPKPLSEDQIYDPYSWHNIKRRYSMYFWPWMIFEEFSRTADKEEREKIRQIMEKLEMKPLRPWKDGVSSLRKTASFLPASSSPMEGRGIRRGEIKGERFTKGENKKLYEMFSSEFSPKLPRKKLTPAPESPRLQSGAE